MTTTCRVAGVCGGCAWITRPYDEQLRAKSDVFAARWSEAGLPALEAGAPTVVSVAEGGLRDRSDVAFRRTPAGGAVYGLFDLDGAQIVDIAGCPAMSPRLREGFEALRVDPMPEPIRRASLRLRVAPDGARGLWLDLANVDVKALLDERDWLLRRMEGAFVEIGQRRKPLVLREDGRLKLHKHPELRPWFATWLEDGARQVPLYGPVGGFTQPSLEAARVLVAHALNQVQEAGATRWLELGSGQGLFSLPMLDAGLALTAVERDRLACDGLERAAREQNLSEKLTLVPSDMKRGSQALLTHLESADGLFVDPPRSGLGRFLDVLAEMEATRRPEHLVYVSCYAESLINDLARLAEMGYAAERALGVDQFPQSPRAEWIVRARRH